MPITGGIITKNEEENIEECILSLQSVCEEVVVLDSGSEDKTVELAKSLGAVVEDEPWQGFEVAKNRLNQLASHPYILNLDADERLSETLIDSILKAKPMLTGSYSMHRLNNYCGQWIKHCGWYPDKKIRLFPKTTQWKGGSLHEYPDVKESEVQLLKGDLLHYTYKTEEAHLKTMEKYAALGAKKLQSKSLATLRFKLIFGVPFKFFKMYIIKLGLLDGKAGLRLCLNSAKGQKAKYTLAVQMKKAQNK